MSSAKRLIFVSTFNQQLIVTAGGPERCSTVRSHTLTFVTVAPGCHIRLHSHTNAAAGEDYAHNRRRRTPAVGFGNWPRQIRLASDLTESGTKLRSRVLHLRSSTDFKSGRRARSDQGERFAERLKSPVQSHFSP